ncbi:MAG: presenilin family intramembrane aspartyl protease PSH [archaeon]|nr:presenilin family intramembrane aspartyl protease PSH [archaeon]
MNEEEKEEKLQERRASIALFIGMGSFILLTQIIALLLAAPFKVAGITAFENPEDPRNPLIFFIFIIAFTAFILLVLWFGGKKLVYFVMLAAVAVTIYYVMAVLLPYPYIPVVVTLGLAFLLFTYPEWYVLDVTGLIIGGGAAAIFGISLGILPVLLLMIILAIYDAIAVYKTKHMVALAESVIELRMPVLFVLPRKRSFSLLNKPLQTFFLKKERLLRKTFDKTFITEKRSHSEMEDAFFMGLGDAIIPSLLVVTSSVTYASVAPALGALIGTLAGYAALSSFAGRGKPHAGLPLLNSGAIIGFALGYLVMVV